MVVAGSSGCAGVVNGEREGGGRKSGEGRRRTSRLVELCGAPRNRGHHVVKALTLATKTRTNRSCDGLHPARLRAGTSASRGNERGGQRELGLGAEAKSHPKLVVSTTCRISDLRPSTTTAQDQ